jgi:hypothetical protein
MSMIHVNTLQTQSHCCVVILYILIIILLEFACATCLVEATHWLSQLVRVLFKFYEML